MRHWQLCASGRVCKRITVVNLKCAKNQVIFAGCFLLEAFEMECIVMMDLFFLLLTVRRAFEHLVSTY